MQHTRFKDHSPWEFEELIPKLFIDYGWRQFDLAANISRRDETGIPDTACGHRFKATNGWNWAAIKTATKKNLDESGLVAVHQQEKIAIVCLRSLRSLARDS